MIVNQEDAAKDDSILPHGVDRNNYITRARSLQECKQNHYHVYLYSLLLMPF